MFKKIWFAILRFLNNTSGIVTLNNTISPEMMIFAEDHIAMVNGLEATGEYKRHMVYSRMIKTFPKAKHDTIALAIEIAIFKRWT